MFHIYPVDFCRHLVGKNSEKCLSLWQRLNTLRWWVSDRMDIFLNELIHFYLNNTINLRHLTPPIISCYTHKTAIVSWPQTPWRHFTQCTEPMQLRSKFISVPHYVHRSWDPHKSDIITHLQSTLRRDISSSRLLQLNAIEITQQHELESRPLD